MRLRKYFFPRRASDIACFSLLFTFVPITFVFELAVVVPEFHDTEGLFYIVIWSVGLFVLFNLVGNMLAIMFVDTSIKEEVLTPPAQSPLMKQWHLCVDCETMVPPRSWHCPVCRTCILKRDHHCFFTGCCVGHKNHRFFLVFLVYIAIGSALTTAYNSVYFWWLHSDTYATRKTALKMVFPMLMLILDVSWRNLYLLIYELNAITCAYTVVLLVYHSPVVRLGAVSHERNTSKYNLGWRGNLEMVLGKRWHLAWISPFIQSKLPHDGVHWETLLKQTTKGR